MLALVLTACLSAPNVILISADTLRADRLGFYGHAYDTSPNLDALAAESLVFDDVLCEVPLTSPSFCAMMSSMYPRLTGATRNALPLPEEIATVAQLFQGAGYETVCVQSNWTLKSSLSGLNRGFDVYDDDFHKRRWGLIKSERDGDEVTRIATDLLAGRDAGRPLFAWFHYSDPHAPYKLHRKFNVAKAARRDGQPKGKVRMKYDSEIAFMDDQIGLLLEALPKEDTYIVFIGDHGESLGEHGYVGHGRRIYQTGLRIPMFVHGPGIAAGRSQAPARGIDLATTLLGLAKIQPAEGMLGMDLANDTPSDTRARVIETYGGAVPKLPGAKAIMASKPPQRQGVVAEGWKLILNGDKAELFDVASDPLEKEEVSLHHPERVAQLTAIIEEWSAHTQSLAASNMVELTDDDRDALDALGYID